MFTIGEFSKLGRISCLLYTSLEPGEIHRLENKGTETVRFVVTTSPWMDHADKIEV